MTAGRTEAPGGTDRSAGSVRRVLRLAPLKRPMEAAALILVVVALTSAAAYVAGTRGLGRTPAGLRVDARYVLEGVGFAAAFLVLNLGVGFAIVRTLPVLTGWVVSVYALEGWTLVALSVLQGFAFRRWLNCG